MSLKEDENLKNLMALQQVIRDFFRNQQFQEVLTPPMVSNPGMEVHIHPFEVFSKKDKTSKNLYLHTSPEFYMKELLSKGFEKIFTMSYCFRDEPSSTLHRSQFVMLEWYRTEARYTQIMDDLENLILFSIEAFQKMGKSLNPNLPANQPVFERRTIQEIFQEILSVDILEYLDVNSLRQLIQKNFKDVPLPPEELSFEDLFFLLFLNKIEPELKKYPFLILYEYPAELRTLSTLKESDPRVCERFEMYAFGIELCNCFQELENLEEQKKLFEKQALEKEELYGYKLPQATILYQALEKGINGSSGVALGVERLLMILTGQEDVFFTN